MKMQYPTGTNSRNVRANSPGWNVCPECRGWGSGDCSSKAGAPRRSRCPVCNGTGAQKGDDLIRLEQKLTTVLEALKKTQELYAGLVLANKLRNNPSNSGIYETELDLRSDMNTRLIAELEKVKS